MRFGDSGFGVYRLRISGLGLIDLGFRAYCLGFRGLGFRVLT